MNKIKVVSVFGTRPEAIKMAPLVQTLSADDRFESIVAITAQHRFMLDQVLEKFQITPDYDLDLMKDRQTIAEITSRVLLNLGGVLQEVQPDIVLVHGDTTTTFAGALAAFYNKNSVGHVEAGLRSFDKFQPYPEEINRKLTTGLTDLHFAPTSLSKDNLLAERVAAEDIFVTGNTVIDAIRSTVKDSYRFAEDALNHLDYSKRIIAMTAHRRENLGQPLEDICRSILEIANRYPDVEFVYAVHKNPAVSEPVHALLGDHPQIHLVEPLDIDDMHNLIAKSYMVLTDSGGLQEEAPAMHKPVAVLRNVTERPEGLDAGTLILAGNEKQGILDAITRLLDDKALYAKMAGAANPYGDGNASKRIAQALLYHFGKTDARPADYVWGK